MSPRLLILLAANIIFYAILDSSALPVLIACALITYWGGRILHKSTRQGNTAAAKYLCIAFVAILVCILCFFKYSKLFPLPIGMSFYMLMAISFLVDSKRGSFEEFPTLTEAMVYISFFPTVISGPIVKAKDLIPQLRVHKRLDKERLSNSLWLIAMGAFMKLVMADRLAVCVDKVYATPLVFSGLSLFMASISYTLQLLFDFAGYSKMAIGVAGLCGIDISPNFNLPYIASSPSQFWRRWHISLSQWLTDYVYIPLGGSRCGNMRTYLNIMIVMIVSGLWHGSTINFLVWGILHGLGQVIWRMFGSNRKDANIAIRILSVCVNFLFVSFLWIPFRAATLSQALTIFTRIVTFSSGASYFYTYTFIFAAMLLAVEIIGIRKASGNDPLKPLPFDRLYARVIFCVLVIATAMFAYFGNGAFIYSQF